MPSESVTGTAGNDDATAAVQAATVNVVDVALVGCDKHDSPRAVAVAVPVDKRLQPMAGLVVAGKRPAWIIRPQLRCSEQGFGVRFVVRHPRLGERSEAVPALQPRPELFPCDAAPDGAP